MARIAYMLGHFPTMTETFIGSEMRALEAARHEIFPIALHNPQAGMQVKDAELVARTRYFAPIDPEQAKKLLQSYCFRRWWHRRFMRRQTTEPLEVFAIHTADLANYIRQCGCSHIHAHFGWAAATYAIGAAKLLGLPVTFTCHGSDVYARPVDLALKCRFADAVIGVAPTITADLRQLSATPCHFIPCGVDIEQFAPAMDGTQKNGRWLYVGRLIDCKGVEDIVTAWSQLPEKTRPCLDIVGDGALTDPLAAQVQTSDLQESVKFLGPQPQEWITQHGPFYRAFIAPFRQGSDGSRDTFPMVLKEAMAMALPIVTTNFIDIPELVADTALLCPPATPSALAAAVMKIESMSESDLIGMGQRGRLRVEAHYSLAQQAKQLSTLIESLAKD